MRKRIEIRGKFIENLILFESEIIKNREYSAENRKEILDYAKEFEWSRIVDEYYVPAMNKIIERYQ